MILQKKEQIMEILFVMGMIAGVCIAMLISAYIFGEIRTQINNPTLGATPESISAYNKMDASWHILDGVLPFIVVGLTLALIVTSFLIPTHPIFVVINIVGFMVLVFIGAVMSNTYEAVANSSVMLQNVSQTYYPVTAWTMTNMPWIGAMLVFICSIVMYAKGRNTL